MSATASTAAVELVGLTKRFGNVLANDGINLRIEPGTIHGVVGENGAGKSTAMKLLYGLYRPDSGQIIIRGQTHKWASPADAIAQGVGMVHQHFMLAGPHSALDNILLGTEPTRFGFIDREGARTRLQKLAGQFGLRVEWDRLVEEMPVGLQQRIEILKLLYRDAEILILDEPTAVLTPQETSSLFSNLQKLRDQGKTIILITHKLREIMAFTDRVTVLRGGKVTGELDTARTNPQELANLMVGRKVSLQTTFPSAQPGTEIGVEARNLTLGGGKGSRDRLSGVSFCVRRGEIVGIAGVEGNGQSELVQALLHPRESACRTSGIVKISGHDVTEWPARDIRDLGVALIPEDRLDEGLLPERSLIENFLLGQQRQPAFSRQGFVKSTNLAATARAAVKDYDVRPANLNLAAERLSGGNQQKLIAAREFHRQPNVVIAAQPTRGVDVGAIEFIHQKIIQSRDLGAAILLNCSELDEILALSDRILVMYEGRIVAEFQRGKVNEDELGLKMGGAA